ncbi:MAG: hypothetical protein HOH74_17290, partial [Gemmatimonadetes bacterium]|nr:hypothetical protein [Gemmatimonadota bacterium]
MRTVLGIVLGIQLSFAQMPDSGARADELLARWHRVRQLVVDGALGQDQRREAAMVLVQGQFLANFDASHDPQFAEWVESAAGSRQDVRLRLAGALADLDAPGDRFAGRRGSFFSAYTSTMDGSGQIYSLYVPETYDPTEAHALELRPHSNLKFREPVEFTGAHIVAVCQGRGIEGLGELDAREVLLDVSTHYNIDPDRVYLSGGSIGGGAVWRMLGRYPDLFAAARIDYGWTWGTSRLFLENASNVPISIYHAADDVWVPVEESRAAVRFLADLGSPVLYNETSGGGHSQRQKDPAWSTDDWLLAQRREPYPTQVHYATTTPLRGRSYWLDIREFSDPNKLVRVRARVGEDATGTQLYLHMENIDVLAVDLPRQLFAADRELIVTVG